MLPAAVLALVSIYPVFALLVHYESVPVLLLVGWLGMLHGSFAGPYFGLMSEIFLTQIRSTGMALRYNAIIMMFAGFAPVAFTSSIALIGSGVAPSLYLTAMAFVSMLSLIVLRRKLGLR
jgi:MFS transporter, MHS family, proline/betaine transporter